MYVLVPKFFPFYFENVSTHRRRHGGDENNNVKKVKAKTKKKMVGVLLEGEGY